MAPQKQERCAAPDGALRGDPGGVQAVRTCLEVTRGGSMGVHAAASIAASTSSLPPTALRLLRAAEGLVRCAIGAMEAHRKGLSNMEDMQRTPKQIKRRQRRAVKKAQRKVDGAGSAGRSRLGCTQKGTEVAGAEADAQAGQVPPEGAAMEGVTDGVKPRNATCRKKRTRKICHAETTQKDSKTVESHSVAPTLAAPAVNEEVASLAAIRSSVEEEVRRLFQGVGVPSYQNSNTPDRGRGSG